MNIKDAIAKAQKEGKGISRISWGEEGPLLIPTNTAYCLILVTAENQIVSRWNPNFNDLAAEDWETRIS